MNFKDLLTDDDAVSPVIGVILMVAITVILAAVIGTFVLGLGDQVQQTSPNAQFDFDYSQNDGQLETTHSGGDGVDASELYLAGDVDWHNSDADLSWANAEANVSDVETVTAGDYALVQNENNLDTNNATEEYVFTSSSSDGSDASIRVVWQQSDSDSSSTLRTWDGPDA